MTFLAVLISAFVFLFVEIGGPLLIYSAIGAISNVLMVILFIVFTVFGALADAVIIKGMTRKNGSVLKRPE